MFSIVVSTMKVFRQNILGNVKIYGSSVCVMQWTGVIRDETLIETDITANFCQLFAIWSELIN